MYRHILFSTRWCWWSEWEVGRDYKHDSANKAVDRMSHDLFCFVVLSFSDSERRNPSNGVP